MAKPPLGVCGLGLIGGSFALAQRKLGRHVIGIDASAEAAAAAVARAAVDAGGQDPSMLADCEAILVAVPVRATAEKFETLAGARIRPQAIFDAGSTKTNVLDAAAAAFGDDAEKFVASHPIAGTELSGVRAAAADLFRNRRVLICPTEDTDASSLSLVEKLWQDCGAQTERLGAQEHDRLFAGVSHLPHVLAYALVGALSHSPDREQLLKYAASGFRDFTRIASSNPVMWRDICLANRANLLEAIDEYGSQVADLRNAIEAADADRLQAYFSEVRDLRNSWLAQQGL